MTDYGLRMLLDSIIYLPVKHLDISGTYLILLFTHIKLRDRSFLVILFSIHLNLFIL
jgi:hypothetical protein